MCLRCVGWGGGKRVGEMVLECRAEVVGLNGMFTEFGHNL